ncbi:MAG: carboxypeptidase-like regulatory domain-containing protein, partial [Bacteroidales bacterium]|nr:carboxypeptidase-like regulatory domain-containing protein [Bacteroidales bacterium]
MKSKLILLTLLVSLFFKIAKSESITQIIKGRVFDIENKIPLPGANIIVVNSDPLIGTVTDSDGYFRLEDVSVGRVSIKVSYLGYQPAHL